MKITVRINKQYLNFKNIKKREAFQGNIQKWGPQITLLEKCLQCLNTGCKRLHKVLQIELYPYLSKKGLQNL